MADARAESEGIAKRKRRKEEIGTEKRDFGSFLCRA